MTLPRTTALTIPLRCAPKTAPCPTCGRKGRRVRLLHRRVRSLAYRRVVWLEVTYAEYRTRCLCCKTFRSHPPEVPPKADYDYAVRQAVLDRILRDGLNVERTRAALRRDFLLELSTGFVYDCLRWQVAQLDLAEHRQLVRRRFRGTLCVDELHLGAYTLLLATDPLADLPVAFALVSANDHDHMRRFLANLKASGLMPRVVVTDGSNLYPTLVAELWPAAKHQLCVFHVLQDLNNQILQAVRRLRRGLARRGNAGRKRRRGRPRAHAEAARRQRGPSAKEKAAFVFKHRFLVVTRFESLNKAGWRDLERMFEYLPELRVLWRFAGDVRDLFEQGLSPQTAWRRRAALLRSAAFPRVPELVEAMAMLGEAKFAKMVAFVYSPAGQRVRTNNHVERANRRLRFAEKVRYKWRRRRWVVRYVVLLLDQWWSEAAAAEREEASTAASTDHSQPEGLPPPNRRAAG
jgi:transposase-like protein